MENKEQTIQETKVEEKKYNVGTEEIDAEILKIAQSKGVLDAVRDEKTLNRAILNCFCEVLAELKHLGSSVESFLDIISICSNDKIVEFFAQTKKNLEKEKKRLAKEQEKKSQIKASDNIVQMPKKE